MLAGRETPLYRDRMSTLTVSSPATEVPIVREADVIVAGAGIAGIFAALEAASAGADTVLIDRYGSVGGNYGPGLGARHDMWQHPSMQQSGLGGAVGDLFRQLEAAGGVSEFDFTGGGDNRKWSWNGMQQLPVIDNQRFEEVVLERLTEAGVSLILSTQVSGTIMDGSRAAGVFVESRGGRQAIRARCVVDTSGEADVCAFAAAPCDTSRTRGASGIGIFFRVRDVDWDRYEEFRAAERDKPLSADERRFLDEVFFAELGRTWPNFPRDILPSIKRAWESGEYRYVGDAGGLAKIYMIPFGTHHREVTTVESVGPGARQDPMHNPNAVDSLDPLSRSTLEAHFRLHIHRTVRFFASHVPGFERASVEQIAPYMGSRYGRTVIADHTLSEDDIFDEGRFDDVVHRFTSLYQRDGSLVDLERGEEGPSYEVPLRAMLPQQVDGIVAAGRSVNTNTRSVFRNRWAVMIMGGIAGAAAALAARTATQPRQLDPRLLQRYLVEAGYHLGDRSRLAELGLT